MQNAKDTFYEVLRERVAALNPERTVVVRGVTRPGVLVGENELVSAAVAADCFVLAWTDVGIDTRGALPAVALTCEVVYATAGTAANGGMDRGRALAGMDAELMAVLAQEPRNAVKKSYVSGPAGTSATDMATRIWWGEAVFGEAKALKERMQRVVKLQVMSFQEAGEM